MGRKREGDEEQSCGAEERLQRESSLGAVVEEETCTLVMVLQGETFGDEKVRRAGVGKLRTGFAQKIEQES